MNKKERLKNTIKETEGMKKIFMKNYKHGELAKTILKGLVLGGFIVVCFALPGFAQVATLFQSKGAKDNYRIKRTILELKKKRFVDVYEKDGKEVVEITELGKKRVLEYDLDDMKLKIPKKWDGLWRIVSFDIPESKKRGRDAISNKIKELGMYSIQKSMFISHYPCKNEIDFIGEFFNVRKYIIYMKVKEIEGVTKLKKLFKI